MHPVIKHLINRKNKRVPVQDGRKIALVLLGGTMTGVRGGGSCLALIELGLQNAFDEIYTQSAGFCNASYFLGGGGADAAAFYYEVMAVKKFLNFFRVGQMVFSKKGILGGYGSMK